MSVAPRHQMLPIPSRPLADQTIAAFAVDLAASLGSSTIFTLTGGMAMYLNRAVATHTGIRVVYGHHEQAVVAAAEGYAKARDFVVPGLAVVTSGPGVTNTITSLCSAFGDSAPVIVLAGQVKTADLDRYGTRTHGAQEVRSRDLVSPAVKRFLRLELYGIVDALVTTFADALAGRPGPVFVEIPLDIQSRAFPYTPDTVAAARAAIHQRVVGASADSHVDRLAEDLRWVMAGKRPLLYVGNGCRIAGVGAALGPFVAAAGIPIVHSWLSADLLGAQHPLDFGAPGGLAPIWANRILSEADRILFLGARLDLGTTAFQREGFGGQAERRVVDVDPAELAKFAGCPGMRTCLADLRALPTALAGMHHQGIPACPSGWLEHCEALRRSASAEERRRLAADTLNVYGVAQRLSSWSRDRICVPTGSGAAIETFLRFFAPDQGTRCHFGASLGAMGLGLPQAIGAACADARPVMCIEGDGGLLLNVHELATLQRLAPAGFILFVMNNEGYQSIRASHLRHFGAVMGADPSSGLAFPDLAGLCDAFRLPYRRIDTLPDFDDFLAAVDPSQPPQVVELMVGTNEPRGPSVKTVIHPDGRIGSTPIGEIDW